jgi:arylsulfatase A-like enzyme
MQPRLLLSAGAILLALFSPQNASAQTPRRPNIVYILADDLGWTDLGCQGSKYYETPHIDRLAKQGMRFTSYYNSQNCAPTRAALMSGQYAPRTGVFTVGSLERGQAGDRKMIVPVNQTQLPLDRVTVAQSLKDAGYATALFGKWHLGNGDKYHPARRGFDEAIVSMGKHFDFDTNPNVEVKAGTYLADFLTDLALRFIEKNKDRPFFLYLPHFGVHSPFQAKKERIAKFAGKPPAAGHANPTYAAMIASVDESVGRVLAKLEELGLADNTIVIFSSDNGGVHTVTSNAPLRGGKGMLYEGGLRVPFIVRWPGKTPPLSTCPQPAVHVDLFPTLLEVAGAKAPRQTLDGVSLAPLFSSPDKPLGRDAIYFHFPGYLEAASGGWRTTPAGMIRSGDFTLLEFFEDGRLELYNLKDDLGQQKNLAAAQPDKTRELHAKLVAWRTAIGAPMPRLKGGKS